jgi:hypothetical protein
LVIHNLGVIFISLPSSHFFSIPRSTDRETKSNQPSFHSQSQTTKPSNPVHLPTKMAQRTPSPLPGHGPSTSRTVTQQHPHQTQTQTLQPTLRLRGASISTAEYIPQQEQQTLEDCESEDRRIRWADDVIDNEGMGKKSSKGMCVFLSS